jgi:predicted lipoprotein with Yx(FWY)xxD motif
MINARHITLVATAAFIPIAAFAGCGGGGSSGSGTAAGTPPKTASGGPATLGVEKSPFGQILDDGKGRTVYLFKKDQGTASSCTGACAAAWPPVRVSGKPVSGTGVNASRVGTTKRSDGGRQMTYNGHPLYTFTGDKQPGDTNGQGLNAFGGGWAALSPAGNAVSGTASNSGGAGGY